MPNIIDILARAQALMNETALNSITPSRAGGIMYDTLLELNQLQLEGGSLLLSKVYASVAAMEADTTPTSDLTGRALKPGQLAVIAPSDPSSADLGSIYRYNGPGSWTYTGKTGGLPMDNVPIQGSEKGITSGAVYAMGKAIEASTVNVASQQSLTDAQKLQGRTNIGAASEERVGQLTEDVKSLGNYSDNDDYVYVITDSHRRILFAIKNNGGIVWGKLSDEAKQKLVQEFITSEPGESEDVAASQKMVTEVTDQLDALRDYMDSESYVYLLTDSEGRIIEAVDTAGVKHVFAKVEFLQINRYLNIAGHQFAAQGSGDYLQVLIDADGKVIEGIRLDGTKDVNVDVRQKNLALLTESNDDYIAAMTDNIKRVMLGLERDGSLFAPKIRSESIDVIKRVAGVWLGKTSIIGDSISTYEGYIIPIPGYPDGAFYPHYSRDITNVNQTWWKMLIDTCGDGMLEVNASYGGSRATTTSSAPDFYVRTTLLGHPDTIFVALGSNDSRNARMGDYDYESPIDELAENEFIPAYTKGVRSLLALYPSARIVLVMLAMRDTYKQAVVNIGQHYGLQVIDAGDYFTGQWLDAEPWVSGNVHPLKNGMLLIARTIYKEMLKHELNH